MAKGQMRSNKEKKKPKAEHNKKQKGVAPAGGLSKPTFSNAGPHPEEHRAAMRLEGWPEARCLWPWFETRR